MDHTPPSIVINLSLGFRNPSDLRTERTAPTGSRRKGSSGGAMTPGWGVENNTEH